MPAMATQMFAGKISSNVALYRLIDLEFACELQQMPFTPDGEQIPCASLF